MAKPTIKFNTVAYKLGDKTGYRPQLAAQDGVYDLDFCKEVVEAKRLAMSAEELLHATEMLGEVAGTKLAEDGRPRGITKLIKWNRYAQGNLESPADAWDSATCKCVIKPQLLADAIKVIDASFVNETQGIKVKLNFVTYIGATGVQNVIKSLTAFAGYGNHMEFDPEKGDVAWIEDTKTGTKLADLVCTKSDVASAEFEFPNEIVALEAGTLLTFVMKSRGGVENGAVFTCTKTVTYLGYSGDIYVWDIRTAGLAANTVKVDPTALVTIRGVKLENNTDVRLTFTCADGTSDTVVVTAAQLASITDDTITFPFTQEMVDATSLKDHDLAGATGTLMVRGEGGIVDDFAFKYAE